MKTEDTLLLNNKHTESYFNGEEPGFSMLHHIIILSFDSRSQMISSVTRGEVCDE